MISDELETIEQSWEINYFVYHPPIIEPAEEQSTISQFVDALSANFMTVVIATLIGLIVILLAVRMKQTKSQASPSSPPPPKSFFGEQISQNRYQQVQPKYGEVPAAPDLTMLDNKWK